MDAYVFLEALTVVLCTAGATTLLFKRLRQPVVLGYIVAGLIVGPHVPIPIVASRDVVFTLSEAGVILVMFSLGLEFSLKKLSDVGPTAGLTAVIESSIMAWLGFLAGRALGWEAQECLFLGAIVAISSTTIIAKAFGEQGIRGKLRELVVGILIVEDLIAILLMALLTAIASDSGLSAGTLLRSGARLSAFLVGLIAVGLISIPRLVRMAVRTGSAETTLVASVGICFAGALLAHAFGYSVALGAFVAGSMVAESGESRTVERLVQPVRDLFAAIFFVSVGMLIDPRMIAEHWRAVAVLTPLVILGKVLGVSVGAFLAGNGTRTSIQAGMSLAQIGEFSFIIAGLGIALRATGVHLYSIAVAVSAITTLTTPWLIRLADPVASYVDRKLPRSLQTYAALYGSWIEQARASARVKTTRTAVRRLALFLLLDGVLLGGVIIGAALSAEKLAEFAASRLALEPAPARALVIAAAVVVAAPFAVGIWRIARRLGVLLAEAALPAARAGATDLAAAPRRALVVTLQLAAILLAGLPILALTQPLVPGWPIPAALAALLVVLGFFLARRAADLQGHVRAGSQVLAEALLAHSRKGAAQRADHVLDDVRALLPGLGEPIAVRIENDSVAVGKTLSDLRLRGRTGASVLAIARSAGGTVAPTAEVVLQAGDILALAGTQEAVRAASELLRTREESDP